MSRTAPAWSSPASCSTISTAQLKKHGLWFPVDVSTASRATIGGMAGNNSCGGRSLRYGTMRDNTLAMDAALADGTLLHFGEVPRDLGGIEVADGGLKLFRDMLDLGDREAAEIADKFPKVQRRVGGYNLDALVPRNAPNNMAHLLVGSEGTLAFPTQVELKLWPRDPQQGARRLPFRQLLRGRWMRPSIW